MVVTTESPKRSIDRDVLRIPLELLPMRVSREEEQA